MRIHKPKKRKLFQWLSGPITKARVVHTVGKGCRLNRKSGAWAVNNKRASVIRAVGTGGHCAGH